MMRRLMMMTTLLALLPALASAQTGLAARYTMEPGSVPPAPTDGRAPGVVVSKARDGAPLCGSGAAYETNWNGVVAWNDPQAFTGAEIPVPTKGRYFLRATFRLDADVDRKDGAKLLRVGYPGGITFELLDATSTLKAQVSDVVYWGGVPVTRGCHQIEVAITPTGVRAWLDDRELRTWGGSGAGPVINIMSNWSNNPGWEHDAANHVYWDNIEVYSDVAGADAAAMWAGTITAGSQPPPPPPAPVDCVVSAWALASSSPWGACSGGTQTRAETWTRTVTQQPENGGAACPALSETRTGSQACALPPVDCAGTWGDWTRLAGSETACRADGTRDYTERRLFTVSTSASNGGAACPDSPESRTPSEACAYTPPPVTPAARLVCDHIERIDPTSPAGGFDRWIIRGRNCVIQPAPGAVVVPPQD